MPAIVRLSHRTILLAVSAFLALNCATARAQIGESEFVTGQAAVAWEKWSAALTGLLYRDAAAAETAFDNLLATEPSAFRLALLAERSVKRNINAGGVLLLEQDAEAGDLGSSGQQIAELLEAGREQMNEADDGWYFASIGRFGIADANFQALLKQQPDPVALLEFVDRVPKRHSVLVQLAGHAVIGESVAEVLRLLQEGERLIKADPTRIKQNIERLGGSPRAFENGIARLKDSGEYAVPFLLQYLHDPDHKSLTQPILRTLPQIGRPALNPLVSALRMNDQATLRYVIKTLGQIGYWSPAPYLLELRDDQNTLDEVREAVVAALDDLSRGGVVVDPELTAANAYYQLALAYYDDQDSLAADPRQDLANIWYWRDGMLQNVEIPTAIFNEIMCLRCCERALRLDANLKPALALWVAANFRREAQLPEGETDYTRPDNFPSAAFFAQSAGADYCLMALARAVDDGDPAAALGVIESLQKIAGSTSIVGDQDGRMPLAEALSFPDRMVRIKAALALGNALPTKPFHNSQNLMPVLNEAVMLFGGARHALVVDPDAEKANSAAGALRSLDYEVITASGLLTGLDKVRNESPGLDVILLASDMAKPALAAGVADLRGEFRFASIPIIIVAKPTQREMVEDFTRGDHRLGQVSADPDEDILADQIAAVSKALGATTITPAVGSGLALEGVLTLGLLAVTNNPLFDVGDAEAALIAALATEDVDLRRSAAQVLGYVGTSAAQQAVARIALDAGETDAVRIIMFTALADAAKHHGNRLAEADVAKLMAIAETDENMSLRTAASQTLGALNLPGNPASTFILKQLGD